MAAIVTASAVVLHAADLRPATLAAYNRYVALTEARLDAERRGAAPFLWLDQQPAAEQSRLLARLTRGEVLIAARETRDQSRRIDVPDGLIHHWVGTVALPGVPLEKVVAFVQDYDAYPRVFSPLIPQARVLERNGDRFVVRMRTVVKKVVTVVMDGDYVVEYHRLGPGRVWTSNVVEELGQVSDAGTPTESRRPADQASGYLWRFRMYCAFEQRGDLSLEQCESISLTRDVPFGTGWLIKPFITGIPKDTITFTLERVRAALVP